MRITPAPSHEGEVVGLGGLADQLDDAEGDEDVHQQVEREELHQPEGHLPGQPPPRHAGAPERARRQPRLRRSSRRLGPVKRISSLSSRWFQALFGEDEPIFQDAS